MKQFVISYNPYTQRFNFQGLTNNGDLSYYTHLNPYRNSRRAFRNSIYPILKIIYSENKAMDSQGFILVFHGTKADYEILCDAYDQLCRTEKNCIMRLKRLDEDHELISSDKALKKITAAYDNIREEFPASGELSKDEQEISEAIEQYHKATLTELNLVVIGAYSAGKSTFINALIGDELLPEGADPTTAVVTHIFPAGDYHIVFTVIDSRGEEHKIRAAWKEDGNYEFDEQLPEFLNELGGKMRQHQGIIPQMRAMLDHLNQVGKESEMIRNRAPGCQIGREVQVGLPAKHFPLTDSGLQIHIFDTPGTDNVVNREHSQILKEALEGKTNVLPILLVDRERLAGESLEKLNLLLKDYEGKGFDLSYMLTIATKADRISKSDLKNGIDEAVRKKCGFKDILYLSAIAALGSKKQGHLSSETYQNYLETARLTMFNVDKENLYARLFEYAELPAESERKRLYDDANYPQDEWKRLFHDSGMYAVEYKINSYADSFLNYMKASQRQQALLKALRLAEEKLENTKAALRKAREDESTAKESKKAELTKKISSYTISDEDYSKKRESIQSNAKRLVKPFLSGMGDRVKKVQQDIKKDKPSTFSEFITSGKKRRDNFHDEMIQCCDRFIEDNTSSLHKMFTDTYMGLAKNAERSLQSIIQSDEALTDEAKETLLSGISIAPPTFSKADDIKCKDLYKKGTGNFLMFSWVNQARYTEELNTAFKTFFSKDVVLAIEGQFKKELNSWLETAKKAHQNALEEKSIALKEYTRKISQLNEQINGMEQRLNRFNTVKNELSNLLAM